MKRLTLIEVQIMTTAEDKKHELKNTVNELVYEYCSVFYEITKLENDKCVIIKKMQDEYQKRINEITQTIKKLSQAQQIDELKEKQIDELKEIQKNLQSSFTKNINALSQRHNYIMTLKRKFKMEILDLQQNLVKRTAQEK